MRSSYLIYFIVLVIAPFRTDVHAELFITAHSHPKSVDRATGGEHDSTQVVGFSRSAFIANSGASEQSVAVFDAFRLFQSIIYNLIERLRGIQFKVDNLIVQPFIQFLRNGNRNNGNLQNDHVDCDINTLGLTDYKLKTISDILAKNVLQNQGLHKRANATNFNINSHLIYRYLAAADWAKKYNGRRSVNLTATATITATATTTATTVFECECWY